MSSLSPQYNPKDVEEKIYKLWQKSGFFNPDKLPTNYKLQTTNYSIVVPPPNITGSLHMGHALNATIQDILIRKKRMEGYRTLWLPGTDHAGIATQNIVEKELKKQGLTRHDLGREKFLEKVWEWKEKYGNIILDQYKKLGSSLDWSRTRFTMDPEYQEAVKEAFIHYYKKGWIYRGERAVNWCPRCATSLSDLEIEYREEETEWYEIKYGPLVIGTVRPETKLGDTAIAVNPKDGRYKKYIGKELEIDTVLGPAKVKVIADPEVDMKFGTGVMKVTPAHDLHDFELAEKYGLEKRQVIGPDGKMTALAQKYAGLKTADARKQIVQDLEAKELLVNCAPYRHKVAVCYRCNTVLEPILSTQWFLKMDELAKKAIGAVQSGKVRFHPKRWEKVYFAWLKNIKDWCISRQIWWGHRVPVWYCVGSHLATDKKMGFAGDIVSQVFADKTRTYRLRDHGFMVGDKVAFENSQIGNSSAEDFIVSVMRPKECPFCKSCQMEQSADILDTWFSSALWPFAALGWPSACGQNQKSKIKNQKFGTPLRGSDLDRFYPTSVLSTARDIINLWVARMIFSGLEFMKKAPFRDVMIHATILTKEGKRMSKSLGTGIDPMDLIDCYGADATRFGLIWQTMGNQDIHWSEEHVVAGKKFANKIWNASRFVLLQISNFQTNSKFQTKADKIILKQLEKTKKEVNRRIEKYEFGQALHVLYDFFWHHYCDIYLEESKKELNADVLLHVLSESLKMLHPFMPFVTEEIWEKLPIKNKKMLIVEQWPE